MLIQIFGLFGGLSLVITFSLDMGLFFFFSAVLGLPCSMGFSLVAVSGGYYLVAVQSFSLWWLLWLQSIGSRAPGLQ